MKIVKLLILLLVLGIISLVSVRFIFGGDEDSWICVNNQWSKHGNPKAPKPESPCGQNLSQQQQEEVEPKIILEYPQPYDVVSSPLIIKGKAKGTWFFEGEFPVTLYYGVGEDFVDGIAWAQGEWMTAEYVDFEATLEFPVPPTNDGTLVLKKNNPSDLEEHNEEIVIKVQFH